MVDDKTGDFRSYPGEIQIAHEWGSKVSLSFFICLFRNIFASFSFNNIIPSLSVLNL